jgi:hypothetical protein
MSFDAIPKSTEAWARGLNGPLSFKEDHRNSRVFKVLSFSRMLSSVKYRANLRIMSERILGIGRSDFDLQSMRDILPQMVVAPQLPKHFRRAQCEALIDEGLR